LVERENGACIHGGLSKKMIGIRIKEKTQVGKGKMAINGKDKKRPVLRQILGKEKKKKRGGGQRKGR